LSINPSTKTLISGSDDNTIFVYKIKTEPIKLSPIGMFPLPGKVTFIHWKPSEVKTICMLLPMYSNHWGYEFNAFKSKNSKNNQFKMF